MSAKLAARDAGIRLGVNRYQRHQPEQTLRYLRARCQILNLAN